MSEQHDTPRVVAAAGEANLALHVQPRVPKLHLCNNVLHGGVWVHFGANVVLRRASRELLSPLPELHKYAASAGGGSTNFIN